MNITPAQLYYITKVYPETVTEEEALPVYQENVITPANRSYWESAANIVNKICNEG